jgi:hypothetical protein
MQSAIFSPFSLPAYVLPFWWSLSFIAVMKVVVASMGAFLLAKSLKMRFYGAFLCGTVFGFGLFMIAWLPWPLASVFAFVPWLLFATERLVRRPGILTASGLAVVVALQFFCGHPESSFQALFATVCFFLLRVFQSPGGVAAAIRSAGRGGRSRASALWNSLNRPVVVFVLAVVAGTAIAAVAILPFLELLKNSSDLTSRPRGAVYVRPGWFVTSLLPSYYLPGGFEIETGFYAGALPLMLAFVGLLRRRVERILVAVFALFCLLVVLGVQPLFGFVGRLPGFDETYLSRLTILYLLCIALLAGWGLDDLVAWRPGVRNARGILGSAAGLFLLPIVIVFATDGTSLRLFARAAKVAWSFSERWSPHSPSIGPVVNLAALIIWVVVAGLAVALLYFRVGRGIRPMIFAGLAILLVVGDLFQAGMGENPAIPDSHAVQPTTAAIRYLQTQSPARFVAADPYIGVNPLPPNVNLRYGLYDARGYDLPVINRFSELWGTYVAGPTPLLPLDTPAVPTLNLELEPSALRVLSLLGVKDILQQNGDTPLRLPGLHVVYRGSDATVYENSNALPRTWLVADQQIVGSEKGQLTAVASRGFDPRNVLISGTRLPGIPVGDPDTSSPGTARITDYGAQQVDVDADVTRASELVLSDTYYPGWRVTVNGRPARINEVDFLLRGVAVSAGNDHIVFTYDPSSFRTGVVVTLSATGLVLVAVFVELRRRRRSQARGRLDAVSTQSGTE